MSTTSTAISTLLPPWILCSRFVMNTSFDKIYVHLLPVSAHVWLASPKAVLNASTPLVHNLPTSKWTELYHFCRIHPYQPISPLHGICTARDYVPKAADIPRLHYSYLDPCLIFLMFVIIYIWPQDDAPPRDQIKLEMKSNLRAFPLVTVLTLPLFQAEVTVIQICMRM